MTGGAVAELDAVQQHALDSLRADGIAVLRFEELFGEQLWDDLAADVEPFIREAEETARALGDRPAAKDEVILRRFYEKKGDLVTLPVGGPWLRFAASPRLLDIVNGYRHERRKLRYVDNWYTVPYPGADKRVASQIWHRDSDDEHVVKAFVYFSDVDEEAGPFQYVRSSAEGGRYGDFWPWGEDNPMRPPSKEFDATVRAEDQVTLTGPAGTMFICDTGGFHRGGFARTKPRVLGVASYLPPETKHKKRRFEVDYEGREAELPSQVRFALS
jgi:hypothetical protein